MCGIAGVAVDAARYTNTVSATGLASPQVLPLQPLVVETEAVGQLVFDSEFMVQDAARGCGF